MKQIIFLQTKLIVFSEMLKGIFVPKNFGKDTSTSNLHQILSNNND